MDSPISELNNFMEEQEIHEQIQNLSSLYPEVRRKAHLRLVQIGDEAIPPLITLLHEGNRQLANEAIHILGEMTGPASPKSLVGCLQDESPLARWDATKALILLGRAGLVALMEALVAHYDAIWLRDAARDVLRELSEHHYLTPEEEKLLAVLEGSYPVFEIAHSAQIALEALKRNEE